VVRCMDVVCQCMFTVQEELRRRFYLFLQMLLHCRLHSWHCFAGFDDTYDTAAGFVGGPMPFDCGRAWAFARQGGRLASAPKVSLLTLTYRTIGAVS